MPSRVHLAICLATGLALSASCSNQVVPSPQEQTSTPPPTPSAAPSAVQSQRTEDRQGPFQLVFELPKDSWRSDEAISGLATLSLVKGQGVDLGGSGSGLFGFAFTERNGSRDVEPVWTADCGPYRLEAAQPMHSAIEKSGGFSADQPDAAFYRAFLTDPIVHLPAGDWTITAIASFVEGQGCSGQSRQLKASILVHVTP